MPKLFSGLTFFKCPSAWFVVVVHRGGSDIFPDGRTYGKENGIQRGHPAFSHSSRPTLTTGHPTHLPSFLTPRCFLLSIHMLIIDNDW